MANNKTTVATSFTPSELSAVDEAIITIRKRTGENLSRCGYIRRVVIDAAKLTLAQISKEN